VAFKVPDGLLSVFRISSLAFAGLFGLCTAAAQFADCAQAPVPKLSEQYRPELARIDTVDAAVAHVRKSAGGPDAGAQALAVAADRFVRSRFYHGYSSYRPCDDWLAYLAGYAWIDLRDPVRPDDILDYKLGACSQQSMVFQAILERLGIEYASVGFPAMQGPGSGHFAAAARLDGGWYYFDSNMEIPLGLLVPLGEVLAGEEVLERLYPKNGVAWRAAAKAGRVVRRDINRNPAPQATLFHHATGFMSAYGWALFLGLFAAAEMLARRRGMASLGSALPLGRWIEASRMTQLRKPFRPEYGDEHGADAAADDGRDWADRCGEETRFRLAQFVGGGDEERRDRADSPALVVRRVELDQRLADIDGEHVGRAEQCQADERERHPSR
jgi:hypothetical protein